MTTWLPIKFSLKVMAPTGRVLLFLGVLSLTQASSPNDLLVTVLLDCPENPNPSQCVQSQVYTYLSSVQPSPRSLNQISNLDILKKVKEVLAQNEVRVQLPEVFQDAQLVFRPGRGIDYDVEFPNPELTASEGRKMMKNNMVMPLLMMLKLKLKALVPILLMVVGLKAMKALLLSKIAIVLVIGFLVAQLCQKLGMAKMTMNPANGGMEAPSPVPYGPPTTSGYEAPASWEPSGGPYSRYYDTASAQNLAYSSYAPKVKT